MSTANIIEMTGKIYWAKVYDPDTAFGASSFKIDFAPDNDIDWEKFKKSGIQKTIKEDPEKGKYFQLVRPEFKLIKGAVVNFTGPIVLDKENKVIVDYISKETGHRVYSYDAKNKDNVERRGTPILIGNGSTVRVKVNVFDTFKGKGHRLDSIQILELIEYKREPGEYKLPELSTLAKELNDEIPFGNPKKNDGERKNNAPW